MTHNFDLRLTGSTTSVTAEILDSPAGQTSAPATVTANLAGIDRQALDVASTDGLRRAGLALWWVAFGAPAVAELWRASLAKAGEDMLRLRLTVDTPELAALPWELLYDETLGRFLALDGRTPVTRFVRLPIAPLDWPADRPLHLLFTGSSPSDLLTLDVQAEQDAIEDGLASLVEEGKLIVAGSGNRATLSDVLSAAVRNPVDIWHFAGHGHETGLVFADRTGKAAPADAGTVGQMLAGEGVRLAVLNACRAGAGGGQAASVAGALLRAGISAVVAMQTDVPDKAARAFATTFYEAVAAGHPVDRAVTLARKAILAEDSAAWWVPALFMRTPEGHIWQPREEQEPLRSSQPPQVNISVTGSGAVAYGPGSVAAGAGGVAAGTIYGGVHIGDIIPSPPDPEQRRADQARTRYLQRLRQRCNVLPLAAMGGEEEASDEVTLDRVYVELDTRTRVPLEEDGEGKRRQRTDALGRSGAEDRVLSAMEAATTNRKLALLGDPGSGKSTFVRQLVALLAGAQINGGSSPTGWPANTLPLLISLRELAPALAGLSLDGMSDDRRDRKLAEAVRGHWLSQLEEMRAGDLASGVEDALDDGAALLIFDGLDEVPLSLRGRTRQAIQAVAAAHSSANRIIVTCRIRSYSELPGFASHTLAAFDRDKIRRFIAGWYQAQHDLGRLTRGKAHDNAADLQGAALSAKLLELASNPMLLTTMAIIHQKEVGLPEERVRLYDLAVQVLLLRWQKRKGLAVSDELGAILRDNLKLRGLVENLAHLAHSQQAGGREDGELARGELLALLEGPSYLGDAGLVAEFLDYVDQRAGLLIGRGGGDDAGQPQAYSFPHRTFQEYLAGCQMIEGRTAAREYWQRAGEGDYWALAAQMGAEELLHNRRNTKDLLDLAYDLCPADKPTGDRQWRAALWSGQMAVLLGRDIVQADDKPGGGETYSRVVAWLKLVSCVSPLLTSSAPKPAAPARQATYYRRCPDHATGLPDIDWADVPAGSFLTGSKKDSEAIQRGRTSTTFLHDCTSLSN
ncbi:MAG: CHAT domain-containing protein [Caldilineales bacterium]